MDNNELRLTRLDDSEIRSATFTAAAFHFTDINVWVLRDNTVKISIGSQYITPTADLLPCTPRQDIFELAGRRA